MDIVICIILAIILIVTLAFVGLLDKKEQERRDEFLAKLNDEQKQLIKSYKESCKVSFKDLFKKKKNK